MRRIVADIQLFLEKLEIVCLALIFSRDFFHAFLVFALFILVLLVRQVVIDVSESM